MFVRSWAASIAVSLLWFSGLHADVPYEVEFVGVQDAEVYDQLRQVSQLVALSDRPPATITALQRRAQADMTYLKQGLHNLALFEAEVEIDVDAHTCPAIVTVKIDAGPTYPLVKFQARTQRESEEPDVIWVDEPSSICAMDLSGITADDVDIILGEAAYPKVILRAEDRLLEILQGHSRPLAKITDRDVIADQCAKEVSVVIYVDPGPECCFGPVTISGLKTVYEPFVRDKITWCEGEAFDPCQVDRTVAALERTTLFRSVTISVSGDVDEDGCIPMEICLTENRYRSIGLGATYETQRGLGGIIEWEHHNIRGIGEQLGVQAEVQQKYQSGAIWMRKPDFLCEGQHLLTRLELEHEETKGFNETAFIYTNRLSRQINAQWHASAGVMLKYLISSDSDNNNKFFLTKLPMHVRWSNADSLLDPTEGAMVNVRMVPTFQWIDPRLTYYVTNIDASFYIPVMGCTSTVLAGKVKWGSIFGASTTALPPPERMYAGSSQTLRGYAFETVSPLREDGKPAGGRSLMVYSFELRQRFTETWGGVAFYEIGNVYATPTPEFNFKQLQSAGFGIRYYTAVGPLRFDMAFPFTRRPNLDAAFQIYFSIGQTF